MNNLTFQQIEIFLTIAKYRNLTEAAEHMFISQPALTRMLQRFEDNIGTKVFIRTNKGVVLTPEGEYLLATLEPIYNSVASSIKAVVNFSAESKKRLQLVQYISYDAVEDFDEIKRIVLDYKDRYPDVEVTETLHDFRELRQQIEYGYADFVISQDFALVGIPGIKHRIISPYNMYIAISKWHPLAQSSELRLEQLRDEPLILVPGIDTAYNMDNLIIHHKQMGFTPSRIELAPNLLSMIHSLRAGKGFSICGRFSRINNDDIKYYPIPGERNPSRVVVAWRSNTLSTHAQNFVAMLPELSE